MPRNYITQPINEPRRIKRSACHAIPLRYKQTPPLGITKEIKTPSLFFFILLALGSLAIAASCIFDSTFVGVSEGLGHDRGKSRVNNSFSSSLPRTFPAYGSNAIYKRGIAGVSNFELESELTACLSSLARNAH